MRRMICRVAHGTAGVCFSLMCLGACAQRIGSGAGGGLTASVEPPRSILPASGPEATATAGSVSANAPTQFSNAELLQAVLEMQGEIRALKAAQSDHAELLKEIEELRGETAELRAELKARTEAVEASITAIKADENKAYEHDAEALRVAVVSTAAVTAPVSTAASTQETAPAAAPAPPAPDRVTPFADHNWGWLNGNPRTTDCPLCTKYFTPEVRVDVNYNLDFNHPKDDTINGSSEVFRSQEVQLEQMGIGGDLLVDHVHARMMTQLGEYSVTTPRSDGSIVRGQWDLNDAYRYFSEAYGGYHWDKLHGINLDAGIFVSYIGLFSYYNFDNWAYQASFVSSNTPWFFTGVRGQFYLTQHLKIEPWFVNGWQSYARYGGKPGLGGQIKWTPSGWINIVTNNYGLGEDDYGIENRTRFHTDNSVEMKYYDRPQAALGRMAFTLTGDAGCEEGAGVACFGSLHGKTYIPASGTTPATPYYQQSFLGWMAYNRFWFNRDRYALTVGGGSMNNPGRYLVLLPLANGATAETGSAYFPEDPGQPYHGADGTVTYDFMPRQFITYRVEYGYRHSDVPYWAGRGGSTPPGAIGSTIGSPSDFICTNGTSSLDSGLGYTVYQGVSYATQYAMNIKAATQACNLLGYNLWMPDMRRDEQKVIFAILIKW